MPELPEVETIRRTLEPSVEGRVIEAVVFHWPRTCAGDAGETEAGLAGQRIEGLDRHGKYLLFRLRKDGKGSLLVIHLRMTGNLLMNGEPGSVHARRDVLGGRRSDRLPGHPQVRALAVVREAAGAPWRSWDRSRWRSRGWNSQRVWQSARRGSSRCF